MRAGHSIQATSRPTPVAIGWLQRALRHEFAAARQFTLQAVVARRLGDTGLAAECESSAVEELQHAQRFAAAIAATGASFGDGAPPTLPVGRTRPELLEQARATESLAVRMYREAERVCSGSAELEQLFAQIGAEEAGHLAQLERQLGQQHK
jgi:bacterioferritin (cytochrome b1)